MPKGRRKCRDFLSKTTRPGSQDSSAEEPKEKETRLSEQHSRNIFLQIYSRESSSFSSHCTPLPLPDCPVPAPDCHAMDTATDCPTRDGCDSPTMPLLSPEVPSLGELSTIGKDGPPVLSEFGVEDVCDQASDKSEGDSGKENEEESSIKWRGSRTSLTSRASRSSRPRSGPFNQIQHANIKITKQQEKKPVLGEANIQGGPVTRSSQSSKEFPNPQTTNSNPQSTNSNPQSNTPLTSSTPSSNLNPQSQVVGLAVSISTAQSTTSLASKSSSLTSLDRLDTTRRILESPIKGQNLFIPGSPLSPHKIQIPDRPSLADKFRPSLAEKFKNAISSPPKTSSSTKNTKRFTTRKTEGTKATKKIDKLAQAAEGSRQITDFFPIRRSERKKKSEIEKDKMEGIEARLLATDDSDLDLTVREIACKGRGVVAKREFKKGDFVLEYSGELIDIGSAKDRESMYSLDTTKGCYMYYFNHKEKQYCIDATLETGRYGRLVNHSCKTPNCVTKVVGLGEEPRLILVAKQDIQESEELLYDYGDRDKESLKAHPWLAY